MSEANGDTIQVRGWAYTDVGIVREVNQDSFLLEPDRGIFAVADGVGGRDAGDVASKILVQMIRSQAEAIRELAGVSNPMTNRSHRDRILQIISGQVQRANAEVFRIGQGNMATTADVLVLSGGAAYIAHVGDSRIYLIREGRVFRLTNDHTFAEKLRGERGKRSDPVDEDLGQFEHVLTRSIGGKPQVDVDTIFLDVRRGDRFVLCSDGVSDELSGAEIRRNLDRVDGAEAPALLVEEAKEKGSSDNLTAVVVEVDETAPRQFDRIEPLDTMRKVSFLEQIALFEGLEPQELLRVMRTIYRRTYEPGETILERGSEVDSLYMIVEGDVSLRVDNSEIACLRPGEHFGELALFGTDERSADAVALNKVVTLAIPAEAFRRLVEIQDPELGNKLLKNLLVHASNRIRSTTDRLVE